MSLDLSVSVRVSVCRSLCVMYVVPIIINVSKLLYVRRPTSSPRAVWNPCKIKHYIKIMSPTIIDYLDIAHDDADLRKPILTKEEDKSILVFSC